MSKKRGRKPQPLRVPEIPDSMFRPVANALDRLIRYYGAKWPHGVNPEKSIHSMVRDMGPVAEAYRAGVRAKSLYDKMVEIKEFLIRGGVPWCPNHNRVCPWGCEMECYLQDAEWREPE